MLQDDGLTVAGLRVGHPREARTVSPAPSALSVLSVKSVWKTADHFTPATARMIAIATCTDCTSPFGSTTVHSSSACARPPGPRPMVTAGIPRLIGRLESVLLIP